jgi:hypothetical protein
MLEFEFTTQQPNDSEPVTFRFSQFPHLQNEFGDRGTHPYTVVVKTKLTVIKYPMSIAI